MIKLDKNKKNVIKDSNEGECFSCKKWGNCNFRFYLVGGKCGSWEKRGGEERVA